MANSPKHVIVVGGGLAGLSAAIEAAEAGANVSLAIYRCYYSLWTWLVKKISFFNEIFFLANHVYGSSILCTASRYIFVGGGITFFANFIFM